MLLSAHRTCLLRPQQGVKPSTFTNNAQGRTVLVHARKRRQLTESDEDDVPEQQQPTAPEPEPIIKSSRATASSRRVARNTRSATQNLVTPHQALREMGIIAVNENGKPFVDVSCLGGGNPHWYAVGLLENKESRYLELLATTLADYGLSCDFSKLYDPPVPGDIAAQAAADALLKAYDVVAWVPRKKAWVYSHNLDRLVEREIAYGRGTGGGTVLLHLRLDPLLVDVISNTYYYLAFRDEQLVPARLLDQAGLLPNDQEMDEVYHLPVPCAPEVLTEIAQWQHTEEKEDEDAKRKEYYGLGGGTTFGESERYDKDKKNLDRDEHGNVILNKGYAGSYNNPNRWSAGPGSSSDFGGSSSDSRGRGRGRDAGRGRGRQQQQQYQQQQYQDSSYSGSYGNDYGQYGSSSRGRGRRQQQERGRGRGRQQQQRQDGGWFGGSGGPLYQPDARQGFDQGFGYNRGDSYHNSSRGVKGGSDPTVRQQQMQWMEDMGSGRYSDDDDRQYNDDLAGSMRGSSNRGSTVGGRDQAVRLRQMDTMKDMGSGRYSDDDDDNYLQNARLAPPRRQNMGQPGAAAAAAAQPGYYGGRGDEVRLRQLDYMKSMSSGRYNDDDADDLAGSTPRNSRNNTVGGKDEAVRLRQMDWMGEMGSGRYSDVDSDDDLMISSSSSSGSSRRQRQQQQQQGSGDSFSSGTAAARQLHEAWRQDSGDVTVDSGAVRDIAAALDDNLTQQLPGL